MAAIKIAIMNASTVLGDADVKAAVPALQKQVHDDFAPIWGVDADLQFVAKGIAPPPGCWWLAILDDSDTAGALGYHDLTNEGLPIGKVFAGTDKQYGLQWTVTASHELLEMLVDPDINLCAFTTAGGNTGTFYAYEVCDPCELDEQGYEIDGVLVSDFVYPAWFEGFQQSPETQFDHAKAIKNAFGLLPGGYAQLLDIPSGLGWYQVDLPVPQGTAGRKLSPSVGTRRERRTRNHWRASGLWIPMAKATDAARSNVKDANRITTFARGIWIPMVKGGDGNRRLRAAAAMSRTPNQGTVR